MSVAQHLRIGELAMRAGVSATTVRYYESIGLTPSPRREHNGYRAYAEADIARVVFIRRAQALGLPLAAIRDILAAHDAGDLPCCRVRARAEARVAVLERQIAELQRLRDELADLAARAAGLEVDALEHEGDICPAITERRS